MLPDLDNNMCSICKLYYYNFFDRENLYDDASSTAYIQPPFETLNGVKSEIDKARE
jgi:hypothetical protein